MGEWTVRRGIAVVLCVLLWLPFGCATDTRSPAPVRAEGARGHHVVVKGDTLYSIAFRAGIDYRELARINGIAPPYVIHPGQRLRLRPGDTAGRRPPARPARPAPAPAPAPAVARDLPRMAWPASGPVVVRFGTRSKGIDIAGSVGSPVVAAADGEVVYAGSALRGYGNLLILKHDDNYLTAYGHNERLVVREGDRVKARQKIAEIGIDGSGAARLHFEVRRAGTPVDPMLVLPAR